MDKKEHDTLVLSRRLIGVATPVIVIAGFVVGSKPAIIFGLCAGAFLGWGYWDLGRSLREDPVDPE